MTSSPPQSALKSTHRCPSGGQRPNRPLGLACDLAPSPGWTRWLRPPHAARGRPRASKSPPGREAFGQRGSKRLPRTDASVNLLHGGARGRPPPGVWEVEAGGTDARQSEELR